MDVAAAVQRAGFDVRAIRPPTVAAGTARAAFETSLEQLGLDRVDLYLVHWPAPGLGTYREAWADLEQGFRNGLARAIGVAN